MAYRAWEKLKTAWPPLPRRRSRRRSTSSRASLDFFAMGKALYLPPLEAGMQFAPVLTLRCALDQECTDL